MKSAFLNLILRHMLLGTVMVTLGACSFKKEPTKPAPEVIIMEKKEELFTHSESLILSMSEDDFIAVLDEHKMDYVQSIRTAKAENLLDLAIQTKKKKILEYLLGRGFSPLLYSETSLKELSRNNDFFETIRSFQKPLILSLVSRLEILVNEDKLDSELARMGFQSTSCSELLEKIWEEYGAFQQVLNTQVHVVVSNEAAPKMILGLYKTSTCASLKKNATTADLHRWARIETLAQTTNNFSSVALMEFLVSLGKIENFYLEGFTEGKRTKIDPRIIILFSEVSVDGERHPVRDRWFEILNSISSADSNIYHVKYYTPKVVEKEFGYDECKLPHCLDIEEAAGKYKEAAYIFGLKTPALDAELEKTSKNTNSKSSEDSDE